MKKMYLFLLIALTTLATTTANAATVVRENVVSIPEDQKVKPVNPATYETQDQNQGNNNNQSSDDTINKDSNNQNNSDQTTPDQGQKTDGENNSQSQDANSESWLGNDGVAKTPSYNSVPITYERPIGDIFQPQLYETEYRNGDAPLPKINPATGKPLWDTQPFWREDGSFDLYGYLKQFQPYYDKQNTEITAEMDGAIRLFIIHKDAHWDVEHIHPYVMVSIPLSTDSRRFNRNTERSVVRMIEFNECRPSLPSSTTEIHVRRISWIKRSELKDQARITGSMSHFLYSSMIPQLEELMRDWIEDPNGDRFKDKPKYDTESTHIFYERLDELSDHK